MDKPELPQKTTLKELRDRDTTFEALVELEGRINVFRADLAGRSENNEDQVIYSGWIYQTGKDRLRFHTQSILPDEVLGKIEQKRPYPYPLAVIQGKYFQKVGGTWDTEIRKKDYLLLESLQLPEGD